LLKPSLKKLGLRWTCCLGIVKEWYPGVAGVNGDGSSIDLRSKVPVDIRLFSPVIGLLLASRLLYNSSICLMKSSLSLALKACNFSLLPPNLTASISF